MVKLCGSTEYYFGFVANVVRGWFVDRSSFLAQISTQFLQCLWSSFGHSLMHAVFHCANCVWFVSSFDQRLHTYPHRKKVWRGQIIQSRLVYRSGFAK